MDIEESVVQLGDRVLEIQVPRHPDRLLLLFPAILSSHHTSFSMVWPDLPPRDCCLCRMLLLLPFVWPSAGVIGYRFWANPYLGERLDLFRRAAAVICAEAGRLRHRDLVLPQIAYYCFITPELYRSRAVSQPVSRSPPSSPSCLSVSSGIFRTTSGCSEEDRQK